LVKPIPEFKGHVTIDRISCGKDRVCVWYIW